MPHNRFIKKVRAITVQAYRYDPEQDTKPFAHGGHHLLVDLPAFLADAA